MSIIKVFNEKNFQPLHNFEGPLKQHVVISIDRGTLVMEAFPYIMACVKLTITC